VRAHDGFIQNQILEESRSYGTYKTRADSIKQVEQILNNDGFRIGDLVNKFFSDVRDLSANPEQVALRMNVAHSAEATADGFRKLNDSLGAMKTDIDSRLEASTRDINLMTKEIAELNGSIQHMEAIKEIPNELYDRRDMILRDLATKVGLQTTLNDQGHVNINAEGLGILVNGTTANEMVVMSTPANGNKSGGSLDVCIKDEFGTRPITGVLKDGELGGLVHVRDEVINSALQHLDHVAYQFASRVNEAHQEGVGVDGLTGRGLFENLEKAEGAAGRMSLSDEMKKDPSSVAAGFSPDSGGDNRVALKLAELQSQNIIPGTISKDATATENSGTQTINESLNSLVGHIATKVQHEEELFKHQEAILNQLDNYRQSVSGVSLEEEAVNMMQFQSAFNAAAKAMKVGDELFQTVLKLKD
jgi:flagellar hook-associated protein 1 FlgK